ncbi:UNVERIFIED_CONTAM: hypothetical protein PYX00_004459 [Menopon gallinae]|uniref:RRM domain-containing protein n=1 Tax=Menopon gallinae TaxID=328185 RepID=A0AAW2I482_9NEOP
MATNYMPKKKSCTSDSSTAPSSPNSMTALSYVNNVQNSNGSANAMQNGLMSNNGNNAVPPATIVNGQSTSDSPSPGLNNNAPKYGTPVPNRIFVGGISPQTTESELAQLFSAYGNVKGTKIIVDRAGVSKGYGFVTFETELEARRIMRDSQFVMFKQRKLNIAPAIKKQPFSRSLDVQSPPIGIPSTVMYANGSPYVYHNGMAFFSPPEPPPNFQATPANQIPAVPGAATVCPTMMYPCPTGQPLYQYPYQPVPGHMYRSGQTVQYYVTPQPPPPPPPPMMNTENAGYCSYDGQYMQYGDPLQAPEVPVPQVVTNPVYLSTVNPQSNANPVYHPSSSKPAKTEEKPHKKRNKMTYRSNNSSPVTETCFVDEGASGDATNHQNAQGDYCQKYSEADEKYNSNTVYYVVPNAEPTQTNFATSNYVMDNNYVLDPSQTQGVYYGNPQNSTFGTVLGQNGAPYPSPSYGTAYVHQYVNNPYANVPNSSYYLSIDGNYGGQSEQKDSSAYWNRPIAAEERRSRSTKANVKVKNVTPCKHKSTSTKDVTKDMKNLKL